MNSKDTDTQHIVLKYLEALEKVCKEHSLIPVIQKIKFDTETREIITSGIKIIPLSKDLIEILFKATKEEAKLLDENMVTETMERLKEKENIKND